MGSPPTIGGTFFGGVTEDSGAIVTGTLTEAANIWGDTWSINSGAAYGSVSINASGVWSYDLDDTNATVNALTTGQALTDTFVVLVTDARGTDIQVITITINGVSCFAAGVLIETEFGPRDCASLQPGDQIWTQDHGLQPVRWIGRRQVRAAEMAQNDKLRPVRIRAGALGAGLPQRDLVVSRQHRLLVASGVVEEVCGTREVFLPAIRLVGRPGIDLTEAAQGVKYIHLLFDRHQVIMAEGAPSESLLLGEEALQMLSQDARDEIDLMFQGTARRQQLAVPARMIPQRRWQQSVIERSAAEALLPPGYARGRGQWPAARARAAR